MRLILGTIATLVPVLLANALLATEPAPADKAAGIEFFEKRVRPLLAENCYRCHGSGHLFEDFHRPRFEKWYVTGDAFGQGLAQTGDIIVGELPNRPISQFVSGGAHSGLLGNRLLGELRSRTFTIDKRYVQKRYLPNISGQHL